jgi:hypothetical protein
MTSATRSFATVVEASAISDATKVSTILSVRRTPIFMVIPPAA